MQREVPPAQEAGSGVLAGIGLMLFAIFLFAANDTLGKWLVGTYTVGQVLLIRSLAALAVLAPFIWRAGAGFFMHMPRPGLQALRVVFSTIEVGCFYWAVVTLPLADVMTYYLAAPIYLTAVSPWLLGETIGWRRWAAVLAGFVGVLIALQPAPASLSQGALLALLGSFLFVGMMVTTRKLAGTADVALVTTQTAGALAFGAVLAPYNWVPPSSFDLGLLALLGVVSMGAHMCVNRSLKLAPASVVVPYQYTMIVWAVLLGYLVFGDVPTPATLAGAAIIVGAGLFIFFRERAGAGPGPGAAASASAPRQ